MLIFCLCDVSMPDPFPIDMVPLVWLFVSSCTMNDALTYQWLDEAEIVRFQYEGWEGFHLR